MAVSTKKSAAASKKAVSTKPVKPVKPVKAVKPGKPIQSTKAVAPKAAKPSNEAVAVQPAPAVKRRFPSLADIKSIRLARRQNQHAFWVPLGVTQSGGSRYESHRKMPLPVRMLLQAVLSGMLTEDDLKQLMVAAKK